jgi:hypothetical protein
MSRNLNVPSFCGLEPVNDFFPAVIKSGRRNQLIENIPKVLRKRVIGYGTKIIRIRQQSLQPTMLLGWTIE